MDTKEEEGPQVSDRVEGHTMSSRSQCSNAARLMAAGMITWIAGCYERQWVKPGATQDIIRGDYGECERQSRFPAQGDAELSAVGGGSAPEDRLAQRLQAQDRYQSSLDEHITSCMRALGYADIYVSSKRR